MTSISPTTLATARRVATAALAVSLVSPSTPVFAQRPQAGATASADTSFDVKWRNLGPNQAGRMTAVAGSTARPDEYYMGTTGGGVWKTTDGGKTVAPVTDAYFGGTIGSIEESFIARLRQGDCFVFAGRVLEYLRTQDMTAYVQRATKNKGV
ncbi:MAG: hypothetical protein K2Y33_08805, partial [Mycolicibacterium frederiksbergense]|nr:hypothetical protein [Mycolicibacterium frederiksbergense]